MVEAVMERRGRVRSVEVILLVLIVLVAGLVAGNAFHPVDKVEDSIRSSSTFYSCKEGWTETAGWEPDTQSNFVTCLSPDKRYIITAKEGKPVLGFDNVLGQFVEPESIK